MGIMSRLSSDIYGQTLQAVIISRMDTKLLYGYTGCSILWALDCGLHLTYGSTVIMVWC